MMGSAALWRTRPRWFVPCVLVGSLLAACGTLTGPAGARPLTVKEQVYQAGGVLLGIGQELEFALQTGTLAGDRASAIVQAYDAAFQLYRRAAAIALAGDAAAAGRARLELLGLIDQLRRDLTAAALRRGP